MDGERERRGFESPQAIECYKTHTCKNEIQFSKKAKGTAMLNTFVCVT